MFWADGGGIVWLDQHKLLASADQAVEVLEGVRVEDRPGAPAAEPHVREAEVVHEPPAGEGAWHLPLLVHGRGEVGDHVDVFLLVALRRGKGEGPKNNTHTYALN